MLLDFCFRMGADSLYIEWCDVGFLTNNRVDVQRHPSISGHASLREYKKMYDDLLEYHTLKLETKQLVCSFFHIFSNVAIHILHSF